MKSLKLWLCALLLPALIVSCLREPETPMNKPQTPELSVDDADVTRVSLKAYGTFGADMKDITEYGVEYSEELFENGGSGVIIVPNLKEDNSFVVGVTNLSPNSTYYLRAYVTNGYSKLCSPTVVCKTPETSVASLSDVTIKDDFYLSATIEDNGDREVKEVGFVWSETSDSDAIHREKRYAGTLAEDGKTFTLPFSTVGYGVHYILAYAYDDKSGTGFSRIPYEQELYDGDAVKIEDPNFEKYLLSYHDKDGNGVISYADLKTVSSIIVETDYITSVREIGSMPELNSLKVIGTSAGSGKLTALPIQFNDKLTSFDCSNNSLVSLDASKNSSLTYLNCLGNPLETLYLDYNQQIETLLYPSETKVVYVNGPNTPSGPDQEASSIKGFIHFHSSGSSAVSLDNFGGNTPVLYYSMDAKNWKKWNYESITVTANSPLYLCGDNPNGFSQDMSKHSRFVLTGDPIEVMGSIMFLINKDEHVLTIPNDYCFYELFYACNPLISGPALPATILSAHCYESMYGDCHNLTVTPELPATSLRPYCYAAMFSGCTNLVSTPELAVATLVEGCYKYMFSDCDKLSIIKCLAENIDAADCTSGWVQGVNSVGQFIKSDKAAWEIGGNGIPSGWTVKDDGPLPVGDVYDIPDSWSISLNNVLVYAVGSRSFVVGDDEGKNFINVYCGNESSYNIAKKGDRVNVNAYKKMYAQTAEINDIQSVKVVSSGNTLPGLSYSTYASIKDNKPSRVMPVELNGLFFQRINSSQVTYNYLMWFDDSGNISYPPAHLYWPDAQYTANNDQYVDIKGFWLFRDPTTTTANCLNNILISDALKIQPPYTVATIRQILDGTDGVYYKLTATVSSIDNTDYGNLYVTDDSTQDTFRVYGLLNLNGKYPKDVNGGWESFSLSKGKVITIIGKRYTYNGIVEIKDATLIRIRH